MKGRLIALIFLSVWSVRLYAQLGVSTTYNFIRYKDNVLVFDSNSESINHFFNKWYNIVNSGQGNLNIVHIGGSHVQAGTLTNTIRCNLLTAYPNLVSSRGLIFPYSAAARCNNPPDYSVHCAEKVVLTRNVSKVHPVSLGLCGIAITAHDVPTSIGIVLNDNQIHYSTSRIVVLGSSLQNVIPRIRLKDRDAMPSYVDKRTSRYVFNLNSTVDSFTLYLPCKEGQQFTLTGIQLSSNNPGISYHSIGVNGASVPDYLRCENFVRDLRLLHPDLVVFGIGINDANGPYFDTAQFRRNYLALVDSVRSVNPDCAFIFISNNDSFRRVGRKRYQVNTNGKLASETFRRLAVETGGALWDQFTIMGGLKSMDTWYKHKLAQADRVHFTRAGYILVGDLFSDALLSAFKKYAKQRKRQDNIIEQSDNERYRYISF